MASQVLSGSSNLSYTNTTGQNVRIIINYMANCSNMTWADVTVTASATTIGKDIQNITGEFRTAVTGEQIDISTVGGTTYRTFETQLSTGPTYLKRANGNRFNAFFPDNDITSFSGQDTDTGGAFRVTYNFPITTVENQLWSPNIFYVPLTISRGGDFPVELMLSNGQSFSSVCGAYNVVVIKEDGN